MGSSEFIRSLHLEDCVWAVNWLPAQRWFSSSHPSQLSHLSAQQTLLLMKCPCVFVDVTKNSNLKYKKTAWKKERKKEKQQHSWKAPLSTMHLKEKQKIVPVSLDLLFSWSSYQLQCLEDLLSPSFQSIKKRKIISDLENSTLVTLRVEHF